MEKDLLVVLGDVPTTGMFSQDYWKWEETIATPRLIELGYIVIRWWSPNYDSFGPLVRGVDVEKDGVKYTLTYG